jgi:hypothetical protein
MCPGWCTVVADSDDPTGAYACVHRQHLARAIRLMVLAPPARPQIRHGVRGARRRRERWWQRRRGRPPHGSAVVPVCVCVLQRSAVMGGPRGAEVDHVHNDGCLYVAARVKAKRTAQRPLPQHARALRGRTPPATCGSLERRPAHDSTRWRPRLHTRWCRRPEVHTQPGPTSSEDPCAST